MGLRIRHIQTKPLLDDKGKQVKTPDGRDATTPVLDADGKEIELYSIEIPADVEAEGAAAIDAYVAAQLAPPDPDAGVPSPTNPPTPAEGAEE